LCAINGHQTIDEVAHAVVSALEVTR
jgi:hypothetical protein